MNVIVSPETALSFRRPFTQVVKETINITNKESFPVAFKIKTTAPKQYCVRPNSGVVAPGETAEVQVLLQPMKEEPNPFDYKSKDKFLVQCIQQVGDQANISESWTEYERPEKKDQLFERKLKCTFLPPLDEQAVPMPKSGSPEPQGDAPEVPQVPEKIERSPERTVEKPADKISPPAEKIPERPIERSTPKPSVEDPVKKLEMLLSDARSKNANLEKEISSLKRQLPSISSPRSGDLKPKTVLLFDTKLMVLVFLVAFVLGYQVNGFF